MTGFTSFEEIEAWKEARSMTRKIRKICKRPNVIKDFSFIDQITRASRSIGYNIAEGFESQTNPEFVNFLGYSKRSSGEVRSQLYDALDEGYISIAEFNDLKEQSIRIGKMLTRLILYLKKNSKPQPRT